MKMKSLVLLCLVASCTQKKDGHPPTQDAGGESCADPASCPVGNGTYKTCASADGQHCRLISGDGQEFLCASCADCSAAGEKVSAWCSDWAADGGASKACAAVLIVLDRSASMDDFLVPSTT